MNIVKILLALLVFIAISSSCADNPSSASKLSDAVITGWDMRECACCGGMMLNFNNDTVPYHSEFYLVKNDLKPFGISDTTKFPVYVSIDWKLDSNACINNNIIILKLNYR